ncbi:MAG: 6-phosphofructokinase, partial [Fidelibacterota bacterium]
MKSKRIGILTGGGDCPGLNAVIRAVVKAAVLEYKWEIVGIKDGFEGLILPDKTITLGLQQVKGILSRGGTILGTTNRGNPFHYPIEENDKVTHKNVSNQVIDRIKELRLDALIVIGGDGSLKIAWDFIHLDVPIIGVPKTID